MYGYRSAGQVILWANVDTEDVLCANNRTYHRELPAELGETGEELPEDDGVCLLYLLTPV